MIRKFFAFYKPHKRLFIFDLLCASAVAACSLIYPYLAKIIVDKYIPQKEIAMILIFAGIMLGVYVISALLNFTVQYKGHVLGIRIQGDMRTKLFSHLQKLPFTYYDDNKTGSIMSRITSDLFEIAELAHHGPEDTLISLITIIGALAVLMTFDPLLTLIIFSAVPLMVVFAIFRRKAMLASFKKSREKTALINAEVESSISGIRVTKAYTAHLTEAKKFERTNTEFKSARGDAYRNMGIFFGGMSFFRGLLYVLALTASGIFYAKGHITEGQFASYIIYINILLNPIFTLVNIYEQIQDGMTGFSRFLEILAVKPEEDPQDHVEIEDGRISGDIVFNNVDFSYKSKEAEGQTKVIKNLSFTVSEGKSIAFVGPSGGGKTTLCHLIPRFYEIDGGAITIGGIDITTVKRETLRKNVGIVAQDVFLFAGSIKDNILYGRPDASEEEMIDAAKKANIHDYIMNLPLKYESQVGERGIKLSGGQKQRISIARAFLKNPPILILDEATSALDNVTEMQIQASLEELSKGRTTIIVAHRLSTVKNCDEIMVLTGEGISERGNHESLMAQKGFYAHLYSFYMN